MCTEWTIYSGEGCYPGLYGVTSVNLFFFFFFFFLSIFFGLFLALLIVQMKSVTGKRVRDRE